MAYSKLIQILVALTLLTYTFSAEEVVTCPAVVVPCQPKEEASSEKATILTFYIESDVEQAEDYIEMSLTIKEKDTSLKKAIDKVTKKVESIKALFTEYCKKNGGQDCEERVEVDNFQVEPSYQVVRREPIFNGFVVTHGVAIKVFETSNVGQLVDGLLGLGIYQIEELEWKPHVEIDATEIAMETGIAKGKQLCRHIGRRMGTVLSIEQVFFQDEEDNKDEDETDANNEEEEQDEQEPSVLQFKIECIGEQIQKAQSKKKPEKAAEKTEKKKKAK